MSWRPLLEGERARRAAELVQAAARRAAEPLPHPAVFHGTSARALFFAYLGEDRLCEEHLDAALEKAGALEDGTLGAGMAGLAWTMAHFGQDVDPAVDAALATLVKPDQPAELLYGIAGIGVYALEGMPNTRALLGQVIDALTEAAAPKDGCDLGVAHGQGGPIAVAAAAASWGIEAARPLYDRLVAHLWSCALDGEEARFPSKQGQAAPTRSAWCYGDPGLAAALYHAAVCAGDAEGRERAIALARLAARRPAAATGVTEPSLCHGSASLAHLFNRLHQATGDDALRTAALDWYDRVLEAELPAEDDLLMGSLGIGFALLAGVSTDEPRWDRLLCVTVVGGAP